METEIERITAQKGKKAMFCAVMLKNERRELLPCDPQYRVYFLMHFGQDGPNGKRRGIGV